MLIRGSKDSMSFGEVLPEPGTEIKEFLVNSERLAGFFYLL